MHFVSVHFFNLRPGLFPSSIPLPPVPYWDGFMGVISFFFLRQRYCAPTFAVGTAYGTPLMVTPFITVFRYVFPLVFVKPVPIPVKTLAPPLGSPCCISVSKLSSLFCLTHTIIPTDHFLTSVPHYVFHALGAPPPFRFRHQVVHPPSFFARFFIRVSQPTFPHPSSRPPPVFLSLRSRFLTNHNEFLPAALIPPSFPHRPPPYLESFPFFLVVALFHVFLTASPLTPSPFRRPLQPSVHVVC